MKIDIKPKLSQQTYVRKIVPCWHPQQEWRFTCLGGRARSIGNGKYYVLDPIRSVVHFYIFLCMFFRVISFFCLRVIFFSFFFHCAWIHFNFHQFFTLFFWVTSKCFSVMFCLIRFFVRYIYFFTFYFLLNNCFCFNFFCSFSFFFLIALNVMNK